MNFCFNSFVSIDSKLSKVGAFKANKSLMELILTNEALLELALVPVKKIFFLLNYTFFEEKGITQINHQTNSA